MVHQKYQDASVVSVEDLPSLQWLKYQRLMDVLRSMRAILEDDRGTLYASLYIQDTQFERLEALQQELL